MSSTTTNCTTSDKHEEHYHEKDNDLQILCSDGLPRLSLPPAPTSTRSVDNDDVINESSMDLPAAYEALTRPRPSKDGMVRNQNHPIGSNVGTSVSSSYPNSHNHKNETPMAKFMRLKQEVAELEMDFISGSKSMLNSKEDGVLEQEMGKMVHSLMNRLDVLGYHQDHDGAKYQRHQQQQLMEVLQSALAASSVSQTRLNQQQQENEPHVNQQYTLSLSQLEERVARIEASVGSSAGSVPSSSSSIAHRLGEVEKSLNQIAQVDQQMLDRAAARAKVIKADLEAAVKAKSKLLSSSSSNSMSQNVSAEDTKMIAYLHDQMTQLSEVSLQLPVMAQRLNLLSSLHIQAASFANRLTAAEQTSTQVQKLLKNVEASLDRVESGTKSNLELINSNMKLLDERMVALH